MTEPKKEKFIVISKFAHFKPNDTIEFDPENVPSAAVAHVRLVGEGDKKAEDESIGVLRELCEIITGVSAHPRAGAVKISASIQEFLAKAKEGGDTDE